MKIVRSTFIDIKVLFDVLSTVKNLLSVNNFSSTIE